MKHVVKVLVIHIESVHEGKKDHKCEACDKVFGELRTLNTHIKIVHEGIKDYKCEACGKTFSLSCNLKTHIKTVHEKIKNREKCGKCEIHVEPIIVRSKTIKIIRANFPKKLLPF